MIIKPIYSDINLFSTTDNHLVYDLLSIDQAITTLLLTTPGERVFNPEYGCDLSRYLWDFGSQTKAEEIYDNIVYAINRFVGRCEVLRDLSTVLWQREKKGYVLDIWCNVPSLAINTKHQYLRFAEVRRTF